MEKAKKKITKIKIKKILSIQKTQTPKMQIPLILKTMKIK